MSAMNDQDLDALFRRAADQHRVPFSPEAWDKMQTKLGTVTGAQEASAAPGPVTGPDPVPPDADVDALFRQAADQHYVAFDPGAWHKMQEKLDAAGAAPVAMGGASVADDQALDALFRQATDQYHVPYSPAAWDKMQAKLDTAAGASATSGGAAPPASPRAGGALRFWIVLLLIAALIGGGWWYYQGLATAPAPPDTTLNQASSVAESPSATLPTPASPKQTRRPDRQTTPERAGSSSSPARAPLEAQEEVEPNTSPSADPGSGANNESSEATLPPESSAGPPRDTQTIGPTPAAASTSGQSSRAVRRSASLAPLRRAGSGTLSAAPAGVVASISRSGFGSLIPLASQGTIDSKRALALPGHPLDTVATPAPTRVVPRSDPSPRWRLSVGVSPDISAVNLGEAEQVGSKALVGLEYFVRPRLSVSAGVVFSHKVYAAAGEDYQPEPDYWNDYPVPPTVDARCNVLDIPLNVRYYAVNRPRARAFLSAGVSSYLMLTEDYTYPSQGGNRPPREEGVTLRHSNQHYFKVANISVGYERVLSRRWALQAEPFVKMPLAGVGFGKVKLMTTGVFFSLHYQLR